MKYADLKAKATAQEPLPPFALKGVKITFNVDADYTVVRTQLTRNVVGIVPGTDPKLKDTYVAFGAHYDHIGYQERLRDRGAASAAAAPGGCEGQTRATPKPGDLINNGADDDGSGTVTLMALAKAFALGPKPKRSLVFVWHTGEEAGLYGSRYNADFPVVPLDKIVAQLNMDMVGRNRYDKATEENVVLPGRLRSHQHRAAQPQRGRQRVAGQADEARLRDERSGGSRAIYTRSDHYSYAAKGIPIIFYTTGLHPDYHQADRQRREDQLREDGAHGAARVLRPGAEWPTSITRRCATTRGRGWGRGCGEAEVGFRRFRRVQGVH